MQTDYFDPRGRNSYTVPYSDDAMRDPLSECRGIVRGFIGGMACWFVIVGMVYGAFSMGADATKRVNEANQEAFSSFRTAGVK